MIRGTNLNMLSHAFFVVGVFAFGYRAADAQVGGCCLGSGVCITTDSPGCDAIGGDFLGVGSACSGAVCTGACCLDIDSCIDAVRDDCVPSGGSWLGPGMGCEICPGPVSTSFTYQGRLTHEGDALNSPVDLRFSLWNTVIGGDQIGSDIELDAVEIVDGLFTVDIDFGHTAFGVDARWLQVSLRDPHDPTDTAPFVMLAGRQQVTAAPFALQTRGIVVSESDFVGIGIDTPTHPLHVVSNRDQTIYARNESTGGFRYGGYFESLSNSGRGAFGACLATTGSGIGVFGRTDSLNGYGVWSSGDYGGNGAKFFVQPHPGDPSKEIRFVSLEGNESGTYFRGSGQLIDGRAVIDVPEEFRLVSESSDLTVQLTAMGPDAGLWVESKSLDEVVIRGHGSAAFDYLVNGVRRGFLDMQLVRENRAYVPEVRGIPFGTQLREGHRQILVENGILNPDYTPNEQTAADWGWELREPTDLEISRSAEGISKRQSE